MVSTAKFALALLLSCLTALPCLAEAPVQILMPSPSDLARYTYEGKAPSPGDIARFSYDGTAPLDLKQVAVKVRDGATIEDITYTGSNGDTVPAYLVIPKGAGKFAGVIWGHWLLQGGAYPPNREEFLDEAVALAPAGVISLLIDAPPARPGFKWRSGGFFGPQGPVVVAQQVADLRRGLDLLLSRPDIDAGRIAYVGHSFGSLTGALLDATDKRFTAFVLMSGPQLPLGYKSYAKKLGPAPALFQYGLHDKVVPLADAKDYVAVATGRKTVKFYDADHALNDKARIDRDSFLRETLKLAH